MQVNQWFRRSKFRTFLKIPSEHQTALDSWWSDAHTPEPRRAAQDPRACPMVLQPAITSRLFGPHQTSASFSDQRGQSAVLHRILSSSWLIIPITSKVVPPSPRSSSLSHIRHVLQGTPILPWNRAWVWDWGNQESRASRAPSAVFYIDLELQPHQQSTGKHIPSLIVLSRRKIEESKGMWYIVTCGVEKHHFALKKFTTYLLKRGMWYSITKGILRPLWGGGVG